MSLKVLGAIIVVLLNVIAWLIAKGVGMSGKVEEIEQLEDDLNVNDKVNDKDA